jgi:hypothetical protein
MNPVSYLTQEQRRGLGYPQALHTITGNSSDIHRRLTVFEKVLPAETQPAWTESFGQIEDKVRAGRQTHFQDCKQEMGGNYFFENVCATLLQRGTLTQGGPEATGRSGGWSMSLSGRNPVDFSLQESNSLRTGSSFTPSYFSLWKERLAACPSLAAWKQRTCFPVQVSRWRGTLPQDGSHQVSPIQPSPLLKGVSSRTPPCHGSLKPRICLTL